MPGRRVAEKQAVGDEGVDVRVEIKVFTEGVQSQDDARNALRA
jgi:hypothetical protein